MYTKKKLKNINSILLTDWDPVGVGEDGPKDEYESYALQIAGCLEKGGTQEDIRQLLYYFEMEYMEIQRDEQYARKVAEKLYYTWITS